MCRKLQKVRKICPNWSGKNVKKCKKSGKNNRNLVWQPCALNQLCLTLTIKGCLFINNEQDFEKLHFWYLAISALLAHRNKIKCTVLEWNRMGWCGEIGSLQHNWFNACICVESEETWHWDLIIVLFKNIVYNIIWYLRTAWLLIFFSIWTEIK